MTTVRETRRASELAQGDWIRPGLISPSAAEVLHAVTYPHPGEGNLTRTHLVLRELGIALPFDETFDADYSVELAADAELVELREQAGRAQKIADLRSTIEFLAQRPWLPLPDIHVHAHLQSNPADDYRQVLEIAEREGVELDTSLDDRTVLNVKIPGLYYSAIAWHQGGRPTEPVDETPAEHPSWPTEAELKPWESLAPAAERVAESMKPIDPDSSMEAHYDAEPVHMDYSTGESMCGLAAITPHKGSYVWAEATCPTCIDEPSF